MADLEKLFSEYAETLGNNNQHGHWEAANIEIIRELYEIGRAQGRIEGLQEAAELVREKCAACDKGVYEVIVNVRPTDFNEYGVPMGSEEEFEPVECQYCGIPMSAIRARIQELQGK